uniref:Helicase SEN1 n=1 Tax=Nelumbo nucifera TaxID=4432 RepID=A0A822ZJ75_NELNU|nr:TPA_asm: hypothetical protein HUJ06_004374 [Nelumbo nucifera]
MIHFSLVNNFFMRFSDAFNFLISLPKEAHIWCASWDLMAPLLETFYNYFKDKREDSPLKILWKRISCEMQQCTQCICQHHQAQEMFNSEYEEGSVGPLLNVLRSLDEERVTQHLKEINAKISRGEYDPECHNAEVVSVVFEVLMFPILLEDLSLVYEFQIFIEAIDNSHELTLAGHQQYPGVYALLFLKSRRSRSIGLRLAGYMGKIRRATDLEPLQSLLKKCIVFLEGEVLPSTLETSRPRVQLERSAVWHGLKALLGFLEPPVFEEGVLERYPIFLSIVLNHVSDDSLEFTYAVNCLKLLFEMLGCKVWLRTTLSPSVMRNTLLGQCFHTRNEKSHKEIFDLFQPFLQSLESLQDGEHEKQRRHFLYFLLHQVTNSSNFSDLMKKKACQIALLIIHRGYMMNPPCPPYECAHMWGPSLLSSLKDSHLHSSLRQPALDLIQIIIVSDAAALVTSMLKFVRPAICNSGISTDPNDDEDEFPLYHDIEEKGSSCWSEFSIQNRLTSHECRDWMCIPMLWFDVLVEVHPSILPISFSKAVIWALSQFSMVEPQNRTEMALSVGDWFSSLSGTMSISSKWELPTGSDDGGDGKESRNAVKAATMYIPLIKAFKRFATHFVIQMEHGELWKQWTWEPRMAGSLVLLFFDPNDNVRHVSRLILEHVSKTRGLASGLQFLCDSALSLSSMYFGLRHSLKLVQAAGSALSAFQNSHHLFFILHKLLKGADASSKASPNNPVDDSKVLKFSSQGGFLRNPVFDASPINIQNPSNMFKIKSWEQFSCLSSEIVWPYIRKCLVEGVALKDNINSQMTCVRLLEILPVVCQRLISSSPKLSGSSDIVTGQVFDFSWLHDLVEWGRSSLVVITRYWKQTVILLLDILKGFCHDNSAWTIRAIEKLISCDSVAIGELKDQVSRLSVSLSREIACTVGKISLKQEPSFFEDLHFEKYATLGTKPSHLEDDDVQVLESVGHTESKGENKLIILSDDEGEESAPALVTFSHGGSNHFMLNNKTMDPSGDKRTLKDGSGMRSVSKTDILENLTKNLLIKDAAGSAIAASQKQNCNASGVGSILSPIQSKAIDDKRNETNYTCAPSNSLLSEKEVSAPRVQSVEGSDQACSKETSAPTMDSETRDTAIKELICDLEDDPLDVALESASRPKSLLTKPITSVTRRKVIQLPEENRSTFHHRLDARVKRLKPRRLDDWYRPILEIDYFSTVGLSSRNEAENPRMTKLKEVPVCFKSPEEYVEIFRPLVLEEFKAQLHSSFVEASSSEDMCCGSLSVLSVERIDDFHLIRCVPDGEFASSKGCSENDLVLLTKQPLQNSAHDVHMVGKVERREKDNKRRSNILVIRLYLQKSSSRLNKANKLLTERSKWYISRVMNITPQLREFQALSSLSDIPVLPIILKPTISSRDCNESRKAELAKLAKPLQLILKNSFNDSQLQAISVAIGTNDSKIDFELSLIQGPPGTGKTRTILAIVSVLLSLPLQRNKDVGKLLNSSMRQSSNSCTTPRVCISQSAAIARAWQDAAFARQLNEQSAQISKSTESSMRARVLICAQSNAAVDELVSRISNQGLYGSDGKMYKPYLVRVGNAKTVHPSSLPFFIDTLVDQRLAEETSGNDANNDLSGDSSIALRSNLEKLVERIRFYEAKRSNLRDGNLDPKILEDGAPTEEGKQEMSDTAIGIKLKNLYERKREICIELAAAQAREKKVTEESKALKHKLRKSILREAEIVVTTLSGCGGDLYAVCSESVSGCRTGSSSEHTLFDAVVIDEAAQALEPATLIPLQLLKSKGTKCIMVGDPKQLPATVLSNLASKFLYECSMFERLQRAGHPVIMLTEQYRMHPQISQFPSLHFYDNKLLNGDQMDSRSAPFHENGYFGPYVFYDIIDGQEQHGKTTGALSLYNECEADAAVELLKFFKRRNPSEFVGGRVGIISPYKRQVSVLRSRFSSAFGPSITSDMEFNTVDGFQGREVDILLLSTVRASNGCKEPGINSSSIGFIADVRRMNVALTRAKFSLWIFGNARTLQTNRNWAALVKNAKERNLLVSIERPYEFVFKKPFSAAKKKPIPASSDCHPKDLKQGGSDRNTFQSSEQDKCNNKEAYERKPKNISSKVSRHESIAGDVGNPNISGNKDLLSNFVPKDKRILKDVRSTTKHAEYSRAKCKERNQKQMDLNSDLHRTESSTHGDLRNETNSVHMQETDATNRTLKVAVLKGSQASGQHAIGQTKPEISAPTEGSHHDRESNDGGQVASLADAPKEMIAKRKRQRDAVDALLSSALISSKKIETSVRPAPVRRPLSPTGAVRGSIRPPKPRKVDQSQDRETIPPCSQIHYSQDARVQSLGTKDLEEEWKAFKEIIRDRKGPIT